MNEREVILKLKGRSGCALEIIWHEDIPWVRKYSSFTNYNKRLKAQAEKQGTFFRLTDKPNSFGAPEMGRNALENELFWFEMRYIPAQKYSDYLERATVKEIDQLISNFILYFDFIIKTSGSKPLDSSIVKRKLMQVGESIELSDFLLDERPFLSAMLNDLTKSIPMGNLPEGFCHGDFTLSNMLFSTTNQIYLIDFLDSFLEGPLTDMVKIRQDTKLRWSLMLEGNLPSYKKNKINQVLDYIDSGLHSYFMTHSFYESFYLYFEKMNLLRILPYLKEENEVKFILHHLRK